MPDAVELAAFHLLAGEIDDALAALNTRLEAVPDDVAARRLRAETYTAQNTPDSLHAALRDGLAIKDPTPDDDLRTAVIYERLNDLTRAAASLESAVRVYPDNLRLRQRWMQVAFKSGDLAAAHRAVQGVPDDWRMLEQAADLTVDYASATGEDEELLAQAVVLYDRALRELPSGEWNRPFRARLLLARAGVHLRLNMPDEVNQDADSAAELIPTEPACHFYAGWSLVKRGSLVDGLARVNRALRSASEPVRDSLWKLIAHDEDFRDVMRSLL